MTAEIIKNLESGNRVVGRDFAGTNRDGVIQTLADGPKGDIASFAVVRHPQLRYLLEKSIVFCFHQSMSRTASRLG